MTKEDITLIEKFIQIRNRGHYVDGNELANVYNRVLNKNVRPSNCSSCCRQRVNELEVALREFKKAQDAIKQDELNNVPMEENNATIEAENKPVKKAGRPPKKK